MTISTASAATSAGLSSPTTKSHCPEGAGLIDQSAGPKGSHTPPQACAAPPSCAVATPSPVSLHAQPAEGYKHPTEHITRLTQALLHACLTVNAASSLYEVNFRYSGRLHSLDVDVTRRAEAYEQIWNEYCYCAPFSHESEAKGAARAESTIEMIGAKVYALLKEESA